MSKSDSKVLLGCNKLDLQVVLSHITASFPVLPFFFPGIRSNEHLETTICRDGIQTPRKPTWHSLLFEWRNTSPPPQHQSHFPGALVMLPGSSSPPEREQDCSRALPPPPPPPLFGTQELVTPAAAGAPGAVTPQNQPPGCASCL